MLYYMIRLLDFQSNYNILYAVQLNSLKLILNLRLKFSLRHKQNIQKWEYFGNAFMIYLFPVFDNSNQQNGSWYNDTSA